VAWIVGSDYLLGVATDVPDAAHWIASTKGILFVVATAARLFVVQSPRIKNMSSSRPSLHSGGGALRPYLIFAITGVGVMLAGVTLYRQQAAEVRQRADVVSEIGQSSRFEVWLPLVAQEVDAASASATFRRADVLHALGAV
jgi:hypothetical protein